MIYLGRRGSYRGGKRRPGTFWKKQLSDLWHGWDTKSTNSIIILSCFHFKSSMHFARAWISSNKWIGLGGWKVPIWVWSVKWTLVLAYDSIRFRGWGCAWLTLKFPCFFLICYLGCPDSASVTGPRALHRAGWLESALPVLSGQRRTALSIQGLTHALLCVLGTGAWHICPFSQKRGRQVI